MKKLKDTLSHIDFSTFEKNCKFEIYALDNFKFQQNLDFGNRSGVYMFLSKIGTTLNQTETNMIFTYKPLYLGKTEDLNQRFCNHHKSDELTENNVTHIAIYFCSEETITKVENFFLSRFNFKLNTMLNKQEGLVNLEELCALPGKSNNS